MKMNRLSLLPLAAAMLAVSPESLAENSELDMTMTIMEEGQEPAGFVQKIQLPSPEEAGARDDAAAVESPHDRIADQVREESGELRDEAADTATDKVKDVLSIDGAEDLPEDIVDDMSEELPLLDDDLPVDLPIDPSQDGLPQDATGEAGRAVESIEDAAIKGATDAGSEAGKTLEETKKLIP